MPDTQEREGRFHLWENGLLKRSLESSSESLVMTESYVVEVLQDPVTPPIQSRKLDPLPKKHRCFSKAQRTKKTRKNKRKEIKEACCTSILPTPLVPPQSEEDEAVDKKLAICSSQEANPDLPSEELQSQRDESACVIHQECQHQPCEFSVSQDPGPSPTVTSLASPPLCFGCFLSCVCQTFSSSRKRRLTRGKGNKQSEAGGDTKAPRSGLLKSLAKNKVQPDQSL
ncbi:uncharacterized protein NECTIN3-AS1-like [Tamandua tetradactyla]|uniref:uncharacterized protein NECTIN3-AS1-like n=1 Tax=Tamandua tetradactyla TaxID=48850 RepID=UPI0040545158